MNPGIGSPGHGQFDLLLGPQGDPQCFLQAGLHGVDPTLLTGPATEGRAVVLNVKSPVQRRM